jgi:hypothetical protein
MLDLIVSEATQLDRGGIDDLARTDAVAVLRRDDFRPDAFSVDEAATNISVEVSYHSLHLQDEKYVFQLELFAELKTIG